MPLVRKSPGDAPRAGATPAAASIAEGLASPSEDVRWAAARTAAEVQDSATMLAAALRVETAPRVRAALFTSLARIGTADSAAAILPLLRADDATLRTGALDALRVMVSGVRELLPSLLQDTDVDVRVLSCDLTRALPAEEATPLLCDLLRVEQDLNVCAAAVDVLAEVGQPEALPVLAECAARFHGTPFLLFAIQVAADRIGSRPPHHRG
jgi:hypothetical protein